MSDSIKFDFSKAQNLFRSINDCERTIKNLANRLNSEITRAGVWWQGESYAAYQEGFSCDGGGKSTIDKFAEDTSFISGFLIDTAQSKKDWEQRGKSNF